MLRRKEASLSLFVGVQEKYCAAALSHPSLFGIIEPMITELSNLYKRCDKEICSRLLNTLQLDSGMYCWYCSSVQATVKELYVTQPAIKGIL